MGQTELFEPQALCAGFSFAYALGVAVFILAAIGLVLLLSSGEWIFSDLIYKGLIPILIALTLLALLWYSRRFATKVQPGYTGQNIHHFILTGKPLDHRLTVPQIVALRFAPDDEFRELAHEAVDKSMSPEDIKKTIKNWKQDHRRA